MMDVLIIGFVLMAGYWLSMWALCLYGYSRLFPLPETSKDEQMAFPLLTVIIAAKDEEASVEQTIRELWNQSLANVEWIVINDRSTDRTGVILESLRDEWIKQGHPSERFRVEHIKQLPEGWLGKNHALWKGAEMANGEWYLFVDADIRFHPETLFHALAYVQKEQIDHLTMSPAFVTKSFMLKGFVGLFLFSLNLVLRPWRANNDHNRNHGLGVGAFNLIRKAVYDAIGTHRVLALRPDDDLMLGFLVKQNGFRQRFVLGRQWLEVEWYPSIQSAIRGLEKNIFAGLGYRTGLAFGVISGFFFQYHLPFWLLAYVWFAPVDPLWTILVSILIGLQAGLIVWATWTFSRWKPWEVVVLPISTLLVTYTLAHSVGLALWRGGVYWRGTFYPLTELRKMKRMT